MARIAGIDAIMIYAEDPEALSAWYARHLGIETTLNPGDGRYYGDVRDAATGKDVHIGIYPADGPLAKGRGRVMVNFRAADFEGLLRQLAAEGVEVESTVDETYGRFAYVRDPEGNPIEIWAES